jgi:hypothetical protein
MNAFFAGLPLADIHQDLARNIKSIRVSQNLFDDLSDDPADWLVAQRQELASKPGRYESVNTGIDRPFEEANWFNAIDFPFKNWMASRFCDGRFGIWYGSDQVETTVHETVHHWCTGLLADAGFDELVFRGERPGIVGERKVFWVRCAAALADLRPRAPDYPALLHPEDYTFTQSIGARLHREGLPGLVTLSARCDGENYALLNPQVLSTPRLCCQLSYRLTAKTVEVEREIGKTWIRLHLREAS